MRAHSELLDRLRFATLAGANGERYQVRELLGEGGHGWVFRATQEDSNNPPVVVKVLRPDVATPELLSRFSREASILRAMSAGPVPHPNIVRFYEHGSASIQGAGGPIEVPYIILEYVEGTNLSRLLAAHGGFGLQVSRVRRIMRQVARALVDLHASGIVHRDLKPSNILLSQSSGSEVVKVTDFGLAKVLDPAHQTITVAGATAGYAPPEQYEVGNRRVGPRTDVFSFAAILFETLSGCEAFPPGPGETPLRMVARILTGERPALSRVSATIPRELRDRMHITSAIDREIARATDGDPEKRHASMEELWTSVEPFLRAVSTGASGARPAEASSSAPPSAPVSSNPNSAPSHRVLGRPMTGERLRGAAFTTNTSALVAVGAYGLYRFANGIWSALRTPRSLDAKTIRGVARMPNSDLLLYGEGHATIFTAAGTTTKLNVDSTDAMWLSAIADRHGVVLVGERKSRPGGIVAILSPDKSPAEQPHGGAEPRPNEAAPSEPLPERLHANVRNIDGTTRLHAAARMDADVLLVCGSHGALFIIDRDDVVPIAWGRTGHLFSAATAKDGGAYVVGSGGHALAVSPPHPILRGVAPPATLESVQTTRDLTTVFVDDSGAAWTAGSQGRILTRRAGTWSRVAPDLPPCNFIALAAASPEKPGQKPQSQSLLALGDDGTVVEVAPA